MPGYFETMRLPVLRGRAITEREDARAPGRVMINERAVSQYWPGEDPIGKRISFEADQYELPIWLTVIGVVKNAKQSDWEDDIYPEAYLAALQNRNFLGGLDSNIPHLTLVVHTSVDPAAMAATIKKTVCPLDCNLPVCEVSTW